MKQAVSLLGPDGINTMSEQVRGPLGVSHLPPGKMDTAGAGQRLPLRVTSDDFFFFLGFGLFFSF